MKKLNDDKLRNITGGSRTKTTTSSTKSSSSKSSSSKSSSSKSSSLKSSGPKTKPIGKKLPGLATSSNCKKR